MNEESDLRKLRVLMGAGYTDAQARAAISSNAPISYNSLTGVISMAPASATVNGYLAATDWVVFNAKQSALTFGNLTESTSSILTISGGTASIIGAGLSIQVKVANAVQSGYLTSADWNTFNNKASALGYIPLDVAGSNAITGSINNSATGYFQVPSGTTAQQPATPANGMVRYNSTTGRMEFYSSTAWRNFVRLEGDTMTGSLGTTSLFVGSPTTNGRIALFKQDTATISFGSWVGVTANCAIYFNSTTPALDNPVLAGSQTVTYLNVPSGSIYHTVGANNVMRMTTAGLYIGNGVGSAPVARLHLHGAGATSATFAMKSFQSDAATLTASIDDAGNFYNKGNIGTDGNIRINTASGIFIKEDTNGTSGVATLVLGTVVVLTNKVTSNSRIQLTGQGGNNLNLGSYNVTARTPGISFTITSSNVLDTNTVAWVIIEKI